MEDEILIKRPGSVVTMWDEKIYLLYSGIFKPLRQFQQGQLSLYVRNQSRFSGYDKV